MRVERIGDAVLYTGDVLECLRALPEESVHCVVTSPPYWSLRNYDVDGQIGLEPTPEEYTAKMVEVFAEVRRVLRGDGTCWVNLGDSYAGGGRAGNNPEYMGKHAMFGKTGWDPGIFGLPQPVPRGLKPKDLVGIPWRVAFALQADGWYLRSDIIWVKPNPMPESVTDRPTKAHEYVFLLSKSAHYFYDQEATREPHAEVSIARAGRNRFGGKYIGSDPAEHGNIKRGDNYGPDGDPEHIVPAAGRNRRTVWTIATQPFAYEMCTACGHIYEGHEYKGLEEYLGVIDGREIKHKICFFCGRWDAWLSHFATFPQELVEPCVLAGCPAQTCPECGAPWERVVERDKMPFKDTRTPGEHTAVGDGKVSGGKVQEWLNNHPPRTTGHRPTCTCGLEDTVPGVMLDSFCGAGTALLVALRLGRRAIGIELKPEYMDMTRKRIAEEAAQGKLSLAEDSRGTGGRG